jgi:hypothetical protein
MKSIAKFLLFSGVLFAVSCNQPMDMLTIINADGSCSRVLSEYADSAFLAGSKSAEHNPFSVELDSLWKLSWSYNRSAVRTDFPLTVKTYDSISDLRAKSGRALGRSAKDGLLVFARRDYQSVEELDRLFRLRETAPWSKLKVKHSLDKKFRWFYSYYTYRETYPKIHTGFEIPIEKFMTKEEAMFWFTGKPDILQDMNGIEIGEYMKRLESDYDKWFQQNAWNDEYLVLIQNYDKVSNKPVSKEKLKALRDSIFKTNAGSDKDFQMLEKLNKFFKTNAFSPLWEGKNSPMTKFEDNYKSALIDLVEHKVNYKLILPGKVLQSGDAVLHGDTLCWNLTGYRMIPGDYSIEAQSRKANVWAFILTGLALIGLVGGLVMKWKR